MKKLGLAIFTTTAFAALAFSAHAQQVNASGCAEKGVESGCVVLKDKDTLYNITHASPKPVPGTYGTVTGT
ncbi:hypothetical protein NKI39_25560 [Mesorhizobium sp. M0664]|uniref:hypothetical protein n=1 Tax=Mesorhizobium sp. M0664 TaxID=2956982 RepID=UPI003339E270